MALDPPFEENSGVLRDVHSHRLQQGGKERPRTVTVNITGVPGEGFRRWSKTRAWTGQGSRARHFVTRPLSLCAPHSLGPPYGQFSRIRSPSFQRLVRSEIPEAWPVSTWPRVENSGVFPLHWGGGICPFEEVRIGSGRIPEHSPLWIARCGRTCWRRLLLLSLSLLLLLLLLLLL